MSRPAICRGRLNFVTPIPRLRLMCLSVISADWYLNMTGYGGPGYIQQLKYVTNKEIGLVVVTMVE